MAEPPTEPTPSTAPDPEALIRSDNPWDWLLASFLGLDGEMEAASCAVSAGRPVRRGRRTRRTAPADDTAPAPG